MIPVVQALIGLLEKEKEKEKEGNQTGRREERHSLYRAPDGGADIVTMTIIKGRAGDPGGLEASCD